MENVILYYFYHHLWINYILIIPFFFFHIAFFFFNFYFYPAFWLGIRLFSLKTNDHNANETQWNIHDLVVGHVTWMSSLKELLVCAAFQFCNLYLLFLVNVFHLNLFVYIQPCYSLICFNSVCLFKVFLKQIFGICCSKPAGSKFFLTIIPLFTGHGGYN